MTKHTKQFLNRRQKPLQNSSSNLLNTSNKATLTESVNNICNRLPEFLQSTQKHIPDNLSHIFNPLPGFLHCSRYLIPIHSQSYNSRNKSNNTQYNPGNRIRQHCNIKACLSCSCRCSSSRLTTQSCSLSRNRSRQSSLTSCQSMSKSDPANLSRLNNNLNRLPCFHRNNSTHNHSLIKCHSTNNRNNRSSQSPNNRNKPRNSISNANYSRNQSSRVKLLNPVNKILQSTTTLSLKGFNKLKPKLSQSGF